VPVEIEVDRFADALRVQGVLLAGQNLSRDEIAACASVALNNWIEEALCSS
jgi:hypothetical protein